MIDLPPPMDPPVCVTETGNPDGNWCIWTNPANGKQYVVDWDKPED